MNSKKFLILVALCFLSLNLGWAGGASSSSHPLVLQEMTWPEVKAYLEKCDMVIIPLGSTEQHGPHLPLGTDFYEAVGMSKLISARTGVMVAPLVFIGYSAYHSGFPGTLSLKPETLEEVIFESVEWLLKYGFRRFMFFNYHGGNNIIQTKVIHRINHQTQGIAIAIGHGSPLQPAGEDDGSMDWHAGVSETSIMLYLQPELVRLEKAAQPVMTFTPQMKELQQLATKDPSLRYVWSSLLGVPEETGKGGASHQLSSNGVWSFLDPRQATAEQGRQEVEEMVERAVKFIQAWKKAHQ